MSQNHITKEQINDIKTIVKSFNDNDYNDFTIHKNNIRNIYLKYNNGEPIAFAYSHEYIIYETNTKGICLSVGTSPNYRRQGYAKELVKKIIDDTLLDTSISMIIWGTREDNLASIKTAESLGFKYLCENYDPSEGLLIFYIYDK